MSIIDKPKVELRAVEPRGRIVPSRMPVVLAITYYVCCVAFAIAPLAICIQLRDIIKVHRARIVDELAKFFDANVADGTEIVQSFEFVKFKYKDQNDFAPMDWFVPSLFLISLLLGLNLFCALVVGETCGLKGLPDPFSSGRILRPSFLAAYCGAYVFLSRALLQAISKFGSYHFDVVGR